MSVAVDIDSVRSFALLVWRGLSEAQRSTMRRARTLGDPALLPKVQFGEHLRTRRSLARMGLMTLGDLSPDWLTPLGAVVREVGVQADDAAAKRRFERTARS